VLDAGKTWWMQAEMLGALSLAYRLTGDVLYRDWLRDQAGFVHHRQRDPRDGEWYSLVYADGTIRDGRKGSPSKAAAKPSRWRIPSEKPFTLRRPTSVRPTCSRVSSTRTAGRRAATHSARRWSRARRPG